MKDWHPASAHSGRTSDQSLARRKTSSPLAAPGRRSMRSLRRAVALGDGWAPFGLSVEQMGEMIAKARELPEWDARSQPIERILRHDGLLDPQGQPEHAAEAIRKTFAAGATRVNLGFVHESRDHYIEQLEALASLAID